MKISTLTFRLALVALMAMPIPSQVWAAKTAVDRADSQMVSTSEILSQISRSEKEAEVRDYLLRDDVKAKLVQHGVAAEEMNSRLASLSDTELNALSGHVQEARAGGNILVTVLLVVLIIYFIKRI